MQFKVSIQNCVQTAAISADTAHALHKAAFWCPPKGQSSISRPQKVPEVYNPNQSIPVPSDIRIKAKRRRLPSQISARAAMEM